MTEAAEQYIKNRLGGAITSSNISYDEVNISNYKKLKDDDGVGFFDRQAKLFTNANGEAKLTTRGVSVINMDDAADWYDFDKEEFTRAGENWYTKQMQNSSQQEKDAYLTEVENELKKALIDDYKKRKLTDPDAVRNNLIANVNIDKEDKDSKDQDASTGTSFEPPEFGRVDAILSKLSLRGLKYPIDADYGNTQDYIQINQFKYRAPSKDIFFASDKEKDEKKTNFSDFLDGVPMGTPKEQAIGLVKLPMPNSLADSNNVVWGPDKLNALTAAVASGTLGASNKFLQGLNNFLKDTKGDNLVDTLLEGGSRLLDGAGDLKDDALNELRKVSDNAVNNSNLNTLARGVFGSTVLNALGFRVSPEALLSRGQGVIPNNNLALLFNSPTLREFTFSWKMSPRSREEAIRVNNILRFFKQGMAPKKASDTGTQGRSFFLGTPNVFDIHFKTTKRKANFFNSIDRNDSVLRIKTCACTGAAVSYTPEGMWNAYEDGQPVAITLTLRFSELEPIFDTDYDENDLNFDPNRKDLLPVPIDAVGY